MDTRLLIVAAFAVTLAGCSGRAQGVPGASLDIPSDYLTARQIRPPQSGIQPGSLYYVREQPTDDLSKPAALEPLCEIKLSDSGIAQLPARTVADFDILSNLDASASLSGVETAMIKLGLKGSVSSYFGLKLVNVTKVGITHDDAETAFDKLTVGPNCKKWFKTVSKALPWAIYQIESVYVGDVDFSRKRDGSLDASLSAKLDQIQPAIEAAIKKQAHTQLSGKGLAFAFVPFRRN